MKRILVIDDEQLLLDLLTQLLSKIGYEVDQAIDCRKAAGLLKERGYDAIFLDVKMPLMDGIGFYDKVQSHFPEMAKRIIFLTGDVANRTTADFIKKTGSLYLQKPFTIKEIKAILNLLFDSAASPNPLEKDNPSLRFNPLSLQ
ncbi:MAG: response regulator [Nitrospirae bacterium]|nr:response regulator [Candidatus Manganitrophaceae bacterium]